MPMREEDVLEFWKREKIYERARELNRGKKKFFFLDGPPYATGAIHLGTAWNKILKDAFIRFWRMMGYDVWDQAGYDTHGLPIENKIEKKLGLKSKQDIEKFGVREFIQECKRFVDEHMKTMNEQFRNLGVWMDFDNPYVTYRNEYIEGAWHTFKVAYEKGFLYRGKYPVHVCPHCQTAVAYNEIEYVKKKDPSIIVKFPVKGSNEYLLIWTTTPWTLPANSGIMAHPYIEYVKARVGNEVWIVAKKRLEDVMKKAGVEDYSVEEELEGEELEGLEYESPLADLAETQRNVENGHKVVLSEQYVSDDDGTGLVHTAPGHGKEDYKVGKQYKLPVISPVKIDGTYTDEVGERLRGMFVKDADRVIIDYLKDKGYLVYEGEIEHDYPKCWRCDTPLILISLPQWFFAVSAIRDILLSENEEVQWNPKWAKDRFRNWIESLDDWPISRQRYWGIPLPIWECKSCGNIRVIGSSDELPYPIEDLHKPDIDDVKLECTCGGIMERVPDVLDVWFDSGVAPWASLGYPRNRELFERMWPVDMELEGPDQFRGWWNSQMITSVMTFGRRPFSKVLLHGFVLDAHGVKMSKSRGNIVTPEEIVKRHGRDATRLFFLKEQPWEDFYFSWEGVEKTARELNIIRNIFRFISTYVDSFEDVQFSSLLFEDRWILSRLSEVSQEAVAEMERMNIHKAARLVVDFAINDFSRTYIKLVRDRVWPTYDGDDRKAAEYTLAIAGKELLALLAPFVPFLAESVYQERFREWFGQESIHFHPFGYSGFHDREAVEEMELVREIVERIVEFRKEKKIKLRWPLKLALVSHPLSEGAMSAISRLGNVQEVRYATGIEGMEFSKGVVKVGEEVDKDEAVLREIIRKIQSMRKQMGLVVSEDIIVHYDGYPLDRHYDRLKREVGCSQLVRDGKGEEFDAGFAKVKLYIERATK